MCLQVGVFGSCSTWEEGGNDLLGGGLGGRKKLGIFVKYSDLIVALLRLFRQGYS